MQYKIYLKLALKFIFAKRKCVLFLTTALLSCQIWAIDSLTEIKPQNEEEDELSREFIHDDLVEETKSGGGSLESYTQDGKVEHEVLGCEATMDEIEASDEYASALGVISIPGFKFDMEKACRGEDVGMTGNEGADKFLETFAQMYGMFMGMMSMAGGKTDKCGMISMVIEMSAKATQSSNQQAIQATDTEDDNQQAANLEKVARSHSSRAKTAMMQTGGWAAAFICYAGTLITGGGIDFKEKALLFVKMTIAGALAYFFTVKVLRSLYAEKVIKDLAKLLRGLKGQCNPITERSCYCSEESTKDDPKYCLPYAQANRKLKKGDTPVVCVNGDLKSDPSCECNRTNSCFDKVYDSFTEFPIGGAFFSSDDAKQIKQMATGSFNKSELGSLTGKTLNAMRREMHKLPPLDENVTGLSKKQKEAAGYLNKAFGIPNDYAKYLATRKLNAQAKNMMDQLRDDSLNLRTDLRKARNQYQNRNSYSGRQGNQRVLSYDNPRIQRSYGSRDTEGNSYDFMNKFKKKNKGPQKNRVMDFDERNKRKAASNAQIRRDNRDIFKMISNRYIKSAWKRFGVYDTP